MLIAVLGLAIAGDIVPWAAPWDVQDQYSTYKKGRGEPVVQLACAPLWAEHARVCFRRVVEGRLVRLHAGDLDPEQAVSDARTEATAWIRSELETVPVEGMPHSYWMLRDAGGKAVLGALAPEAFGAELPIVMALPSTSVLVAWKGGDPDLDKVMAIGVTEMHAAASDPVSPVVFGWDGKRWFPYLEAKPSEPDARRATE